MSRLLYSWWGSQKKEMRRMSRYFIVYCLIVLEGGYFISPLTNFTWMFPFLSYPVPFQVLPFLYSPTYFLPSNHVCVPWPFLFPFFHSPTYFFQSDQVTVPWPFLLPSLYSPTYFSQEVRKGERRRKEMRMMNECLTWFPYKWIRRTQYIPEYVVFYKKWGFYLEVVWLVKN